VGFELRRSLSTFGKVLSPAREELDLFHAGALHAYLERVRPSLIVNAAAYTAVDKAESEKEQAFLINETVPDILAHEAARCGIPLIHYSTDYVFSGAGDRPFSELDATAPGNIYGASKLAGEISIASSGADYLIFRTSWVYASRGKNFLLRMLELGRERDELKIVNDQIGAPTSARLIADVTAQIIAQAMLEGIGKFFREKKGIYHLTTRGEASWYDFAKFIFENAPQNQLTKRPRLLAIPTQEYPLPAKRPMNSRLDVNLLEKTFGLALPPWQEQAQLVLEELA
jgi:dTDP-4-dehydrorhamnose reductase